MDPATQPDDAARQLFAPFDRLQASDLQTREALARAIAGTLAAGYGAFVTIDNKAESSAPLSVIELAREVLRASPRVESAASGQET